MSDSHRETGGIGANNATPSVWKNRDRSEVRERERESAKRRFAGIAVGRAKTHRRTRRPASFRRAVELREIFRSKKSPLKRERLDLRTRAPGTSSLSMKHT